LNNTKHYRTIRSFVKREGRITPAQKTAFETLLPIYGLPTTRLDFSDIFKNQLPVFLEIGFGMGQSLAEMAAAFPEINFIGVEVHRPGVGALLQAIHERHLSNIRISSIDAVTLLTEQIPDHSLDKIQIFFPDPWHKKRHHKRRLIQPAFIQLVYQKLKPQGILHIATDWQDYADHITAVMDQESRFKSLNDAEKLPREYTWRPTTKYEQRGERLHHVTHDFLFISKRPLFQQEFFPSDPDNNR